MTTTMREARAIVMEEVHAGMSFEEVMWLFCSVGITEEKHYDDHVDAEGNGTFEIDGYWSEYSHPCIEFNNGVVTNVYLTDDLE